MKTEIPAEASRRGFTTGLAAALLGEGTCGIYSPDDGKWVTDCAYGAEKC